MSIFNIFKRFKSKKQLDIPFNDLHTFEELVEEPIIEEEEQVKEIPLEDPNQEIVCEEERVDPLEEIPELPKEDTDFIPAEEVIDKLRSKYQTYDLTQFLDFDYALEGSVDGYHIHSSEFLKKKKEYLISEFQRLIEKRVDELKDERLSCKNLVIDMRELSNQLVEKFELRIALCNEYIEDLHNEKVLSNSGSGLIRSVLTDYEVGWDRGVSDFLLDNNFLNPLKRL